MGDAKVEGNFILFENSNSPGNFQLLRRPKSCGAPSACMESASLCLPRDGTPVTGVRCSLRKQIKPLPRIRFSSSHPCLLSTAEQATHRLLAEVSFASSYVPFEWVTMYSGPGLGENFILVNSRLYRQSYFESQVVLSLQ